jgi:hypothetical protein
MGRLHVQHCIVNATTRQYGSGPTSDLLGVDYFRTVPADTEFPKSLSKLELFVRFIGDDGIGGRVRITISRLSVSGEDRELVYRTLFDIATPGVSGRVVHDRGFKLINVLIPGEGTYAVRVMRGVRRPWEAKRGWQVLAVEYFHIARAT